MLARKLLNVTPHYSKIVRHGHELLLKLSNFIGLHRGCRPRWHSLN
jgi:hypothetical protein